MSNNHIVTFSRVLHSIVEPGNPTAWMTIAGCLSRKKAGLLAKQQDQKSEENRRNEMNGITAIKKDCFNIMTMIDYVCLSVRMDGSLFSVALLIDSPQIESLTPTPTTAMNGVPVPCCLSVCLSDGLSSAYRPVRHNGALHFITNRKKSWI